MPGEHETSADRSLEGVERQLSSESLSFDLDREQQPMAGTAGEPYYTVSEAIDTIGHGKFQTAMLVYAGLAWLCDAMEMMLLSYLGPAVSCEWGLSAHQEGAISTVVFLGALLGSNTFGALSDAHGRRAGFFATALCASSFGVASALAPSYTWLLLLRGMVGVGLGGAHVPVALYMEFVPTARRGVMLVVLQSFWTIGTVIEALLGWAVLSRFGWRWLLAISSIPLLALTLLYPVLPESPFWLAAAGQTEKAQQVLARLAAVNKKALPPGRLTPSPAHHRRAAGSRSAKQFIAELASSLGASLQAILLGNLRKTTALLMLIWFVNALTYYGEVLLTTTIHTQASSSTCGSDKRLRLSSNDMADVFITSLAELPGLLVAALLVDLIGRKRTMAAGMLVIAASTGSLIVSGSHSTLKLFASRAASMGAYTVLFIYTPEVYPTRVRSFALGLNNSMSRIGAILAPAVSVDLGKTGHLQAAEAVITGLCLAAAAAILLLPVETSGKTLQVDADGLKKLQSDSRDLLAQNAATGEAGEPEDSLLGSCARL